VKDKLQHTDRTSLLAEIAEMYFLEGKNQSEIARNFGMTRSNVSRLLKEARQMGIVKIQINHPIQENNSLAQEMIERFNLTDAHIIQVDHSNQLLSKLGKAAGRILMAHLAPGVVLGTAWGTAISATVDQLEITNRVSDIKVVQLLGALGSRIQGYDGHGIVRRLEELLDAEGIYMNAPFFVDDNNTAALLLETSSIKETLNLAKQADIALLGVGSLDLSQCSYYLAGYVPKNEILEIQKTGAIGDVCGRFYNIHGEVTANEYENQLIGIAMDDLTNIPVRIGVAGGNAKIDPIIGALRGKLINILITDSATALEVLKRTNNP
jgi:DNA-binding transcriptional regulator LsrR (DeoR family)